MSVKAKSFLTFVLTAACLVLARPNAYAQNDPPGVNRTHYWTYHLIDPIYQPDQINTQDQFWPAFMPNQTDSLLRLVNWVYKNNSVVQDTFIHYTWWNLVNKYPVNKFFKVTNQFGSNNVFVDRLEFLLTPAWKNVQNPVPGGPFANHYQCYRAQGFPPPTQAFLFRDEWRQDFLPVGPLEYLCAPCVKEHHGQIFAPPDTVTHLALFRIQPQSDVFFPYIQDQFLQIVRPVRQQPIEYLLVPSLKEPPATPTKKSTWGQVKTLYR